MKLEIGPSPIKSPDDSLPLANTLVVALQRTEIYHAPTHTLQKLWVKCILLKPFNLSQFVIKYRNPVQCIYNIVCLVAQLCLTLCKTMDYSLTGCSVLGVLQARILEWVAIPFSRKSSWLRDRTWVFCIAGRFFTSWATKEARFYQQQMKDLGIMSNIRNEGWSRLTKWSIQNKVQNFKASLIA